MTREEIKIKLVSNLPDSTILMSFGGSLTPATDGAGEWLDSAVEAVEAMIQHGFEPSEAVSHISAVTELSRNLK